MIAFYWNNDNFEKVSEGHYVWLKPLTIQTYMARKFREPWQSHILKVLHISWFLTPAIFAWRTAFSDPQL